MDFDPYRPPKANLNAGEGDSFAPGVLRPEERLSPEVEMRAMAELGKRRAKTRNRTFAIAWPVCTAGLMLVGLGLIPAGLIGSALAGLATKGYMKSRNRALADAVARDLGVNPLAFSPERYLID
jgi:hypothetical protein